MNDESRGTVWEESLVSCPEATRVVALSATIENAGQVRGWMSRIHGPTDVVSSTGPPSLERPFGCLSRTSPREIVGSRAIASLKTRTSASRDRRRETSGERAPKVGIPPLGAPLGLSRGGGVFERRNAVKERAPLRALPPPAQVLDVTARAPSLRIRRRSLGREPGAALSVSRRGPREPEGRAGPSGPQEAVVRRLARARAEAMAPEPRPRGPRAV